MLVLGEGSNLLFAADFPGVVICLTMAEIRILEDDGGHALVRADAGVRLERPGWLDAGARARAAWRTWR